MREPARIAGAVQGMDVDGYQPGSVDPGNAWSWAPYAPEEPEAPRYRLEDWAPASSVRRPWVRVGRWTLLYRRS